MKILSSHRLKDGRYSVVFRGEDGKLKEEKRGEARKTALTPVPDSQLEVVSTTDFNLFDRVMKAVSLENRAGTSVEELNGVTYYSLRLRPPVHLGMKELAAAGIPTTKTDINIANAFRI